MKNLRSLAVASLLAALPVAPVYAAPWYVFAGAGQSYGNTTVDDAELRAQGFTGIRSSEVSKNSSLSAGVGYAISPRWSLEASYSTLGEPYHYAANFQSGATGQGTFSRIWEAKAFGLSAIGKAFTWQDLAVYGKASVYEVKGEHTKNTVVIDQNTHQVLLNTSQHDSGSGLVPAIGVGASLEMAPRLQLRAFYEVMAKRSGIFGSGNDLDSLRLLTFSVSYGL